MVSVLQLRIHGSRSIEFMNLHPYDALLAHCRERGIENEWMKAVCREANKALQYCRHGDLPRWAAALDTLPKTEAMADLAHDAPRLGAQVENREELREHLMKLHPWRKGPLNVAGMEIDTEWRSDWKWSRIAPHVDLKGSRVLDIGCGNGYYGWRMLGAGADLVIGIDPTLVFVMQWLACRHFSGDLPNFVLPLGIEDLPDLPMEFDCVFSMGVLYHRRDPAHHLERLRRLAGASGTLVLETLVLPDSQANEVLVPEGRYARMRNVWAVPGMARLLDWLSEAGFSETETVHAGKTSVDEQRSTRWMTFESLEKALDMNDPSLTIEGHPAPRRVVIIAR